MANYKGKKILNARINHRAGTWTLSLSGGSKKIISFAQTPKAYELDKFLIEKQRLKNEKARRKRKKSRRSSGLYGSGLMSRILDY